MIAPHSVLRGFLKTFGEGSTPPAVYRAPGRINLIGDHTDYSGGFVLPMAIEQACWVAARANGEGLLRIHTADLGLDFEIDVSSLTKAQPTGTWSDYVVGVAVELVLAGIEVAGQDLYVASKVPIGAGLSSSAAIEVASALALLGGVPMNGVALAKLCQRAENSFAGTPCGIMDQFVSVHGQAGSAVRIDCRSLDYATVALPPDVLVVAVNSMVKRQLGASEYPIRRRQCEESAEALKLATLRDATLESVNRLAANPDLLRRARHVVTENTRVDKFVDASAAGDPVEMGKLLLASHRSLRDDYEVSCPELDFLVDVATQIPGAYGGRMTGGGFGGCTVNLMRREVFGEFRTKIRDAYAARYAIDAPVFVCEAAAGASRYEGD